MSSLRLSLIAFLSLTTVGLALVGQVDAQERPRAAPNASEVQRDAPRPQAVRQERSRDRSMSESVRWAQKTTGGQVLGAERVQSEGRDFNRVKLIDGQGRVRYVDDVQRSRPQPSQAREVPAAPPVPVSSRR